MGVGYSRVNFGHPKSEVLQNGGYSGVNFGHPKSEFFGNGGYSGVNFGHFKSEVSEMGGYSGVNFGHPKSEVFQNGGWGGFLVFNSRKGFSGKFGPKFTVQPETCLCITVVSHILRMWRLISALIVEVAMTDLLNILASVDYII